MHTLKIHMQLTTVIFDMDGLLSTVNRCGMKRQTRFSGCMACLSEEQYNTTTGLRTKEFVQWWFHQFNLGDAEHARAKSSSLEKVMQK